MTAAAPSRVLRAAWKAVQRRGVVAVEEMTFQRIGDNKIPAGEICDALEIIQPLPCLGAERFQSRNQRSVSPHRSRGYMVIH